MGRVRQDAPLSAQIGCHKDEPGPCEEAHLPPREPNDRSYDGDVEREFRNMSPEELDRLLNSED